MATVQINNNYGHVQVADEMVFLPGCRPMTKEEYEDRIQMEKWAEEARALNKPKQNYHHLSDGEQTRIAIREMTDKLDKLIELLSSK